VASTRHIDVNWGREKLQCHGGKGALSAEREKGEKKRGAEKVQHQIHPRRKPLWTTDWREKGTECRRFFAQCVKLKL